MIFTDSIMLITSSSRWCKIEPVSFDGELERSVRMRIFVEFYVHGIHSVALITYYGLRMLTSSLPQIFILFISSNMTKLYIDMTYGLIFADIPYDPFPSYLCTESWRWLKIFHQYFIIDLLICFLFKIYWFNERIHYNCAIKVFETVRRFR